MVPIHSVLKPDDKLDPAPLKPPKPEPWPRLPFVAIGVAMLAAIAAWTAVVLLAKRRAPMPRIVVAPVDAFRAHAWSPCDAMHGIMRWARLAPAPARVPAPRFATTSARGLAARLETVRADRR